MLRGKSTDGPWSRATSSSSRVTDGSELNKPHLLLRVRHTASNGDLGKDSAGYGVRFTCILAKTPFRPTRSKVPASRPYRARRPQWSLASRGMKFSPTSTVGSRCSSTGIAKGSVMRRAPASSGCAELSWQGLGCSAHSAYRAGGGRRVPRRRSRSPAYHRSGLQRHRGAALSSRSASNGYGAQEQQFKGGGGFNELRFEG